MIIIFKPTLDVQNLVKKKERKERGSSFLFLSLRSCEPNAFLYFLALHCCFYIPAELGAVFYCCQPEKSMRLWRRLGKSVMLKIWSTAVTHRAPSPPQSHRSLLTNLGVCLRGAGKTGVYIGTSDIDTVAL